MSKQKTMKRTFLCTLLLVCLAVYCHPATPQRVIAGNERTAEYLPLLKGRRVAVFSNHTGMVEQTDSARCLHAGKCCTPADGKHTKKHIVDVLRELDVQVTTIFSPEHGFRGTSDAGEHVSGSTDKATGIPIFSLYNGRRSRPDKEVMSRFDVLVVDIQDVGARFYTYYISMLQLMDACAEQDTEVVILDRPNPNGHYVDGPLLDMKYKSGVGALPIPIVHGMTLGELARMINGEGWLTAGRQCRLHVVTCLNYTHRTLYKLPVPPSPNLPNMTSVYLYPSLCYFEGTPVSLGRGTDLPFQVYGHPAMRGCDYSFTPESRPGAKNPPQLNRLCHGKNLSTLPEEVLQQKGIDLSYVTDAYRNLRMGSRFFLPFFDLLMGTDSVRKKIMEGKSAKEIQEGWKKDVELFKEQRRPYLLYPE